MAAQYSERRLERAVSHVSTHWFPINPDVLAEVRDGLEAGAFDLDTSFLITELKRDFALFSFCVKEVLALAIKQGASRSELSDPLKLLTWAGEARLKVILGPSADYPSSHSLETSDSCMTDRLIDTAISASAAQALGEAQELDGDGIYCHSIVRQVGLNLVAWNYPAVYARVLRSLKGSTTLDEALTLELGFSPSLLGIRLLRPQNSASPSEQREIDERWNTYDSLCEIGEALARANRPDVYPTAERDWSKAQSYVEETIGGSGIDLIRRRALENSEAYRTALPSLFTQISAYNPHEAIKRHRKSVRANENPYLKMCPPALQVALQNLYAEMPRDSVNKVVIERLVKQVFLQAGFTGGCVYVIDPTSMTLTPRVQVGKVTLRPLKSIALQQSSGLAMNTLVGEVINSEARNAKELTLAALSCDQPLIERDDIEGAESRAALCASIGRQRKIGVLYLELPEADLSSTDPQALKIFKALRQTLCDALLVD